MQRVEPEREVAGEWHGRAGAVPVTRSPARPLTPFAEAVSEAARSCGLPWLEDTNDPWAEIAVGRSVSNVVDGVRWNAAFACLDAVRHHPRLRILDRMVVDRIMIHGRRAEGVRALGPNGPWTSWLSGP